MSGVLFDLGLRVRARQWGAPVPRLLHNPSPSRLVRVAVAARLRGRGTRVWAMGPDALVHSGTGAAGLAALARAAGCADGDLRGGATALVDNAGTLRVLAALAAAHADPSRCADLATAAGSSLAGWWAERSAHPGTSAVTDLLVSSRQQMVLGVRPGEDTAGLWRQALGVCDDGLGGFGAWWSVLASAPTLPGLELQVADDDWLLGVHQDALRQRRSWDMGESLSLAAARLRTRCDATELYEAALLGDPMWRARGVHTGHVCHGVVVTGAKDGTGAGPVMVASQRLDTRLKPGSAVWGWPGDPITERPPADAVFAGEVAATAVVDGELRISIGGLRRSGYRPAAGETVTVLGAPPNPATIRSGRVVRSRLYKRRFSWLSQGHKPVASRRDVPLAVLIAAADELGSGHQSEGGA
ncbi:hypothetical protein C0J29_31620 (plasmid) [Mycobacterium paragordonae]|uniref:hypothetical protein n=1 Tax=Mycobacterium TaxID=1763 RepID=UPI000EAA0844|nr:MULTISPECIES: hypothetical protein [Mycobacterium]AYE99518.1 hypothetical protein C0J29_31620 [Mycobacterium paragordonae]QNI09794.1 hypothetical protein GAN17_25735 [Mycobacterium kubicae]